MRTIDDVIRILVTKAGSPTLLTELTIEDMELFNSWAEPYKMKMDQYKMILENKNKNIFANVWLIEKHISDFEVEIRNRKLECILV